MTSPNPAPAKPRFRVPDFDSRQITVGVLAGLSYLLFVAIPTALIPNPVFGREIPPTWWSWPSLIVTSLLVAALTASYIKPRDAVAAEKADLAARQAAGGDTADEAPSKKGIIGAALTYFAVGCPVCNKIKSPARARLQRCPDLVRTLPADPAGARRGRHGLGDLAALDLPRRLPHPPREAPRQHRGARHGVRHHHARRRRPRLTASPHPFFTQEPNDLSHAP